MQQTDLQLNEDQLPERDQGEKTSHMDGAISTDIHLPKGGLHTEAPKRHKTKGETIFNLGTYGGVTWILNEVISALAGGMIQGAKKDKPAGPWNNWFTGKIAKFKDAINVPQNKYPRLIDRSFQILYLCIGGTLVVPIVKFLEDRKGKIVRSIDNAIEGERAQTDPRIVEAHKEMDEAPKQTWLSLAQGRGLVMTTAIALDALVGHKGATLSRRLENTSVKNYASMERAGTTITRDVLSLAHPNKDTRKIIKEMRKGENPPEIAKQEGKLAVFAGGTFGFVTILSAALTGLFYVSSKLFARKHEEKIERKEERILRHAVGLPETSLDAAPALDTALEDTKKPSVRIQSTDSMASKLTPETGRAVTA